MEYLIDRCAPPGMYLIIITKKKKAGDLLGHTIWKATDFDIISYKKTMLHLTDSQVMQWCPLMDDIITLYSSTLDCK